MTSPPTFVSGEVIGQRRGPSRTGEGGAGSGHVQRLVVLNVPGEGEMSALREAACMRVNAVTADVKQSVLADGRHGSMAMCSAAELLRPSWLSAARSLRLR